ncbi:Biotin--protein ligase [Golovinomyces cichoracearum]|uniref:Biotin--protein ligase n=1 Tax=Golovinomyces cichoracearum TaxID=62708 RepID=A0A420HJ51_9PEZI|nr:Biotin--protein ligase [Golovinomyces cichoracearum]
MQKINVLVYAGPGSTRGSVHQCLYSLRSLLSPNYAVFTVTDRVILQEPWTKLCALLVFPGGADTAYCQSLNGDGNRIIEQYVRRGGAYLGFCAGGYYGSSRCEFEIENKALRVVGSRELSFFPGTCRGCAFKGFEYDSEAGARAVELCLPKLASGSALVSPKIACYYNGGGVFVNAAEYADKGIEILANYSGTLDVVDSGCAAVVYCKISEGRAILTGPHIEFDPANLDTKNETPEYLDMVRELSKNDSLRVALLKECLTKLGLTISPGAEVSMPHLSQLHLSSSDIQLVPDLLASWQSIITTNSIGENLIEAENDIFYLEKPVSECEFESKNKSNDKGTAPNLEQTMWSKRTLNTKGQLNDFHGVDDAGPKIINYDSIIKRITPHEAKWPETKETPYFDHQVFYRSLREYQEEKGSEAVDFGKYLMYGEVVTSTSTLLEKNPKLLSRIPTGFTFAATTQVAGRGRGSNLWISPAGSLLTSVYIKHPISLNSVGAIVFIQYLAAIAIVQGIHTYEKGFENLPIKLKWPNDIYAEDPSKRQSNSNKNSQQSYVKIGGILVNSSYTFNEGYNLVTGIGLNTTNAAPTTSLNTILDSYYQMNKKKESTSDPSILPPTFSHEKLLARILTRFETLYKRFCRTGFDSYFHDLYYSYWLHTDQIVTLEAEGGVQARIKGISSNWGLLKVEEISSSTGRPTGKVWELQSDNNSFDFFKGLLKKKM